MKYLFTFILLLIFSCANNPLGLSSKKTGNLEIWVTYEKNSSQNVLAKNLAAQATTWDSLLVKIWAGDILDTIIKTFKFNPENTYLCAQITNIPSGKNRYIQAFTKTKNGIYIHASTAQTFSISPGEKLVLDITLTPIRGSIYIDLTKLPADVDTIIASFGAYCTKEAKSSKMFLSIDNIPEMSDSLIIIGINKNGEITYKSSLWLSFSPLKSQTMSTLFFQPGISLNISAQSPNATLVYGFDINKRICEETGGLIISEIMYNANGYEYIELFNPNQNNFYDSLFVEIDGTTYFVGISDIKSKGFFVIGRKEIPEINYVLTSLDLSSTTGNWIIVKSKNICDTVLDFVAFMGGSNNQEWPYLGSAKKSIILDSLYFNQKDNNFGRNWKSASSIITSFLPTDTLYGTPGKFGN